MSFEIDKRMLPIKAHYFLFNAGTAPVMPFMPTLARQLGFSAAIVGMIYTILPIAGMIAKPLCGMLADRYQRHKTFFIFAQFVTAVSFFCISFVTPIDHTSKINFNCINGIKEIKFCSEIFEDCKLNTLGNLSEQMRMQCNLECIKESWQTNIICNYWNTDEVCNTSQDAINFKISVQMNSVSNLDSCIYFQEIATALVRECPPADIIEITNQCHINCYNKYLQFVLSEDKVSNEDAINLHQFWLFLFLMAFTWMGMATTVTLGDKICFALLGEQPYLYGNQRLWGAIGWGIFIILSGLLIDNMSRGIGNKDYTIVYWVSLAVLCSDMIVSSKIIKTEKKFSNNILKDVGMILLSAKIIIFFLWCVFVGLGTAMIWNFLFWYLEDLTDTADQCGEDNMKTLQGLATGIQCLGGDLPFLFLSGWLLKKIGHVNVMSLVLFGFGVRFTLYSWLSNPWYVLPIEFMNGITFGLFYATLASYASIISPLGTESTLQGLVGATYEGLGIALGSLLGGLMYENFGGATTFKIYGIGAFIVCFLHILAQLVLKKYFKKDDIHKSASYQLIE